MITINLRDFYPWCKEDIFVEITEKMLETMKTADRQESAYKRRTYRYKAHYTLDMGDGIDNECVTKPETPEKIYIREETEEMLSAAMNKLSEIQRRRLKLHFFDGMRYSQIARMEGVTDGSKRVSDRPQSPAGRSPSESPRDTLPRSEKCQSGSYASRKYMTAFVILYY